jgi:outer membrane protein assembly factor BamB
MLSLRLHRIPVNPPAQCVSRIYCSALTLCLIVAAALSAGADDWPRFRGPNLDGISTETEWKTEGEAKILWKAQVGLGHAGFVIADGRAITTGHNGKVTETVFCFDAKTGKEIWKHSYPHPLDNLYYPGGTTGTPTIDGDVVYHLARRGQLFCLEAATGKVVWSRDLTKDLGYDMPTWGFTGSPLIVEDQLYLTAGDAGLALNKTDGSVIWKSKNGAAGYSTPCPLTREGKDLLIVSNKRGYVCVEASTGAEMWRLKWLTRYGVNAAMPIISGDYLFISTGYGKGATLLRFADEKAATEPEEVWKSRDFATQMNAAVLIDGYLYGVHGNEGQDGTGIKCLHMESGATGWTEVAIGHGAVLAAGEHLIALSEKGELSISPVSADGFQPTLRMPVIGAKCWTAPTLANGLLYCRSDKGEVAVVDLRK